MHDPLVEIVARAAERAPAYLECPEAARRNLPQLLGKRLRLVHEEGGIGTYPLPIAAPQEATNRLARYLPQDVPERDVDAAYRVGEAASSPQPKRMLMQFLADPL